MIKWTRGTADILMNLYIIHTPRLRDTWGVLAGINLLSSITVCFQTLFYVENFVSLSYFFSNRIQGRGVTAQLNGVRLNRRYIGNRCDGDVEKHPHKKSPVFYAGGVQQSIYFNPSEYYGKCGRIGCTKYQWFWALVVRTQKLYRGGFYILGRKAKHLD